ncbi:hypothetical protein N0V83_003209 [Neocucurbitaria cava]|uniref:Uncharacterized protein n=1 Tax=Neocucurbitaria cava TaxID=798079 RepID=A0A9W8YAR3_9PLEO|nr:hypothetical protein N0V83_003209 [Neocucurbitaria cava]
MAPRLALAALLLNLAATQALTIATTPTATSAFWTYTSRIAEIVSESPYTLYDGEVSTYMDTTYRSVKSTVTPTATPTSTSTYMQAYDDLQIVYAYYPTGAIAESDLEPAYDYSATTTSTSTTDTYLYFSMPVTMTAPASCPTPFTVTTSASVSVPTEVTDQVTPTSTEPGTTSTGLYGDVYVYQTWYLSESAAPFTTTSDYYYEYYIASCSTPPASYTGSPRSGGSNDDDSSNSSRSRFCYYSSYYCGTPLRTWIIVIASVIPGLFLLGFLESWFWFRRLMMGKSAMRFGTVCWVLISLWVLCFMRMQDRRSKEDQKLLAEKWKNMGSGAAFKAWWKWGFRHAYPVEHLGQFSRQTVGIVPAGQPLHPAMAQAPYSAPGAPGAPPPGALQPVPGQPGQVFYYGPRPPGWAQTPNGGFIPPHGYAYAPQQAGYYGNMPKDGSVVSSSPVSALGQQHPAYSMPPQAPQPVYTQRNVPQIPTPSPPPQASQPTPPQQPQAPVSPVSEAPNTQTQRPPQHPANPPQPRNDPNDRSLYE